MAYITPASIVWSDDNQPFAENFGDCYFSNKNGLDETQHVFIKGNHLPERWQMLQENNFIIGETGFGTGLNFIAAWQLWNEITTIDKHLYFVSAELHPLRKTDLIKAATLWPELKPFYDQLIEQYPSLTPGFHVLNFNRVTLLLMLGDANILFEQLLETDHPDFQTSYGCKIDAWFLDGFAPAKNPALWNESLINTVALLSKENTTAATFSSAGQVRRNLEAAGFSVQKSPGFANKREMVTAIFHPPISEQRLRQLSMRDKPATMSSPYVAPWYLSKEKIKFAKDDSKKLSVVIIGAGIAGCTAAYALAEKGLHVTVIEESDKPAGGASGNLQAVLYSKLSATHDEFAQFNLSSYLYALHFYKKLLEQHPALAIHLCGVLQLAWSEKEQQTQHTLLDFFVHHPEIAKQVTREQANALAGLPVEHGGLFFPQAGWIHPASVCEQLLRHPNITTRFNQRINSLQYELTQHDPEKQTWQLMDEQKNIIFSATKVIIATGHHIQHFEQTQQLPLKLIRGQVSHAEPTKLSRELKTVVTGDGYIAPAALINSQHNIQSFGATYTLKVANLALTNEEHEINLQNLAKSSALLSKQWLSGEKVQNGRAHFRSATPDYLPLCGPAPNHSTFLEIYALLGKNANANIPFAGTYLPNLYVCGGLGSRGMVSAPLCAEVLCAHILGTPAPLPRSVIQALHPARFVVRDLIKNRTGAMTKLV